MRPVARPGWRLAGWMTLAAALLGLVGWPVGRLVAEGLRGGAERLLAAIGPDGWAAVGNSLWTSAAVTVLAMTGALAVALLTTRTSLPGRRWLQLALLVPLVVPDFVSAISWTRAYGPAGLGQRLLGVELPGLYGPLGIVLVLAGGALPLALLVILGGLAVRAEPDLERAARASGASRFTAFRTVTLPLLAPVLAAAAGLVFLTTMNAFGTPAVLGRPAGFATMTTRIYQDLAFSSSDDAFLRVIALSCLLLAVAVAAVAAGDRAGWLGVVRGGGSPGPRGSVSAAGWAAGAVAWLAVIVAVGIPLLALVLTALTRAVGLAPTPENLTLDNFARALDRHALAAIGNTLVLAAATAVGAVGLGLLAVATARGAWRRRLATLVTVTFALPGSVLAVAVLLAYGASLRDTLAIILVAYLAKLWALGHRPVAAAVEGIPSDLLRAARVHGATPLGAARTVLLPILAPALAAAALLVFVFAVHEVTISILLYGPTSATLAVSILNLQQLGDPTLTSALAVLLTVVVSGLAGGLVLLVRGRRLLIERAA
jgi:iron(III) transport system permease protein